MTAIIHNFPTARECYSPPAPCDVGDIGDLEFSEIGRGKHSWGFIVVLAGFLLVVTAVAWVFA